MEKQGTTTGNCLYVAFHLKNSVNSGADAAALSKLVYGFFPEERVEALDLDLSRDLEAIFRVTKPLLDTQEENLAFFQALKDLFEATEEYSPHFTQLYY